MHKFRKYAARFTALLCVCAAVFAALFFALSSTLNRQSTLRQAQADVYGGIAAGVDHLEKYASGAIGYDALAAAVASPLIPADLSYYFYNAQGDVILSTVGADANAALAYAGELTSGAPVLLLDGSKGEICLVGQKTAAGTVLVSKVLTREMGMMEAFRGLLMSYAAPLAILMVVFIAVFFGRIMRPVNVLVEAMARVSGGEVVELGKNLPVELRPLGRALEQMSRRLGTLIAELKQQRDTVTLILEGLDEGILVVDENGKTLRENAKVGRLLGAKGGEIYLKAFETLQKTVFEEQEPLRLQRGERVLLCVFLPMPHREGAERAAIAVIRDVTEHERLERTRREYVANISHELRTPLASIRGIAEGLCDGLAEDPDRAHAMILSEVKRLSRLVNDLLELSSLQSGTAAFEPDEVGAVEVLWELFDHSKDLARGKGVELLLDAPESGLPFISVNEDRLQQVLTILVDNAIKFTPESGKVVLGAETAEGGGVRFFVRDTGIGMDAYTRKHAFDRFHQADQSHNAKGSGLGLAIAGEVVKRLGTRIEVASGVGKGSEFAFVIR